MYRKRLAYDIGWARLDAFYLVPLSLRSAWRRRVAPNLNQKVENATLKNYSVGESRYEGPSRGRALGEFTRRDFDNRRHRTVSLKLTNQWTAWVKKLSNLHQVILGPARFLSSASPRPFLNSLCSSNTLFCDAAFIFKFSQTFPKDLEQTSIKTWWSTAVQSHQNVTETSSRRGVLTGSHFIPCPLAPAPGTTLLIFPVIFLGYIFILYDTLTHLLSKKC